MKKYDFISNGLPSYCTGNMYVINSLMRIYKSLPKRKLLIEATANQVNQFGGYTGKTPEQFRTELLQAAKTHGLPESQLLLGGDHLGPLIWRSEEENIAMQKAEELVKAFVKAGYQKIHLDTSMPLGHEDGTKLTTETIACRGVRLYKACKEVSVNTDNLCFVIGSEVPVPGGEINDESLTITNPEDALETIRIYKNIFSEAGISDEEFKQNIRALVVQPGVEFTKDRVCQYSHEKAKSLMDINKENLVFEGHSTDYQKATSLRNMVLDGVKLLKVGPELTYMLRIALEKMESVEKLYTESENASRFKDVLRDVMMNSQDSWINYYSLDNPIDFEASYLNRSRYYLTNKEVLHSIETLRINIEKANGKSILYKEFPQIEFESSNIFEQVIDFYVGLVVKRYEHAFI